MTIPRELKFPRREGGVKVFRCFGGRGRGVVWRSLYLILKKPVTLVTFGVGGPDLLTPPPPPIHTHTHLYGFIFQKSRESVGTIDAPQKYGCSSRTAS